MYYHQVAAPLLLDHLDLWRGPMSNREPSLCGFYRSFSLVSSRAFLVDAYHGLSMVPIADAFVVLIIISLAMSDCSIRNRTASIMFKKTMSTSKWVSQLCKLVITQDLHTVFRAIIMSVLIVDHWMNANTTVTIIRDLVLPKTDLNQAQKIIVKTCITRWFPTHASLRSRKFSTHMVTVSQMPNSWANMVSSWTWTIMTGYPGRLSKFSTS